MAKPSDHLDRVRATALALPEAKEALSMGKPVFKAGTKTFAFFDDGEDPAQLIVRTDAEELKALLSQSRCFKPRFCTQRDPWIGYELSGRIAWKKLEAQIEASYRRVANKRMLSALDG